MIITSTVSPALKTGLRFFGLWPDMPHSTIYWLIFTSSILIVQYFQYSYVFEHLKVSEISNLVDALIVTLDYSLTFFKLTSLWIHRRVLHQLLTAMDDDWRECINIDQHLSVMRIKADISHFGSNAILSFNAIATSFYFLGDYVIRFISEEYNDTSRQLPVKIQLPFDIQQSPIFEFLAITTFLHVMLHGGTVAILNGLIFTLVLHVGGQIDIICQEFRNISESTLRHKTYVPSLGMLIERHNRIISFSENIEKLFSFIALMQVVWNTLVMCCIGFVFIIFIHNDVGVFVLVKAVFAYIGVTTEAFVICFAGEYLSLKGKSIISATYETLWYDMPSNQGKSIMFIIMRSQKQLVITAGNMMDMSFEAFTTIMKASASYISVLNAMY